MLELMGITEVGAYIGWDRRKTSVYYGRGKLPEPYALIGGKRPVWTKKQIEWWADELAHHDKP